MAVSAALRAHLDSGATTLCRAWAVTRTDGVVLGFTDHDGDLAFEGIVFRAGSGMTASEVASSTGLSVDHAEAAGVLRDGAITEADIQAGRYDGAEVRLWLVNWADVSERLLQFRGSLGEIERKGTAFVAELRGLAEALNRPIGRVMTRSCPAVLGDADCGVDLSLPAYRAEVAADSVTERRRFYLPGLEGYAAGWFRRGRLTVLSGPAAGLGGLIKRDTAQTGGREIELWEELRAEVSAGDTVRIEAGCDRLPGTCRMKFGNFLNFRGFPDIPEDDWVMAYPRSGGGNTGGSRVR